MRRAVPQLLVLIPVLVFVASTAIFALHPGTIGRAPALLAAPFLSAPGPVLAALLVTVWGMLLLYVARLRGLDHGCDLSGSEIPPLTASLLAAAAWPWFASDHPQPAFLLCMLMLIGALAALLARNPTPVARDNLRVLGLYAGWTTAVAFGAFAALTAINLGLPRPVAAFVAVAIMCMAAAVVQAARPQVPAYTVAIIWALVGTASATPGEDIAAVLGAVTGIAALSIVLVRVTT